MDDNKIVAAILTAPILTKLGGDDLPPDVAVSVYEEVLSSLKKREKNDVK